MQHELKRRFQILGCPSSADQRWCSNLILRNLGLLKSVAALRAGYERQANSIFGLAPTFANWQTPVSRHRGLQTFNTLGSASASHPQQLRWSSWKPIQKLPLLRLDSATGLLVTQTAGTHVHTHTVGGLTQGSPTCILGWGTDSSRVAPPPPHVNSLNTHTCEEERKKKKNSTALHPHPLPSAEPQPAVDRSYSQGVIWLCLYKQAESRGRRSRRGRTAKERNSQTGDSATEGQPVMKITLDSIDKTGFVNPGFLIPFTEFVTCTHKKHNCFLIEDFCW